MNQVRTPLRAIRQYCVDCSETAKTIAWCLCDGVHSTWCPLWPYRFGLRPETARQKYGNHIMSPELMPGAEASIDDLPNNPAAWRPPHLEPAQSCVPIRPSAELAAGETTA